MSTYISHSTNQASTDRARLLALDIKGSKLVPNFVNNILRNNAGVKVKKGDTIIAQSVQGDDILTANTLGVNIELACFRGSARFNLTGLLPAGAKPAPARRTKVAVGPAPEHVTSEDTEVF